MGDTSEQDTNGASGPILDPEEIQALMATVDSEESAEALFSTLQPLAQPEHVDSYAFLSDDEGGPQRYPLFVNLQERFGENIKDMFSDLFQREITISFENMQQKAYRDIVRDERNQVFFAFEVVGTGRMLIGADLALIVSTIDAMLGGEGEVLADEDGQISLSPVERKLAERIAGHITRQLEMLWLPVRRMEFRLFKVDTDPQFLAVAGSNDACFTVEFATQWGEESSGFIEIHYPRAFLEPMMETLRAAVSDEPVAEDVVDGFALLDRVATDGAISERVLGALLDDYRVIELGDESLRVVVEIALAAFAAETDKAVVVDDFGGPAI